MKSRSPGPLVALMLAGACALYSDVVIRPLIYDPANIDHDWNHALLLSTSIDAKPKKSVQELAALGEAELAAGRYEDARRHLRAAIDLQPFRDVFASIAWNLSQVEYMSNNFGASLDWAKAASEHGINPKGWYLSYLQSLANVELYQFNGATNERLPMNMGHPDVPRIDVRINGVRNVSTIVDSGAVLSIISQSLADALHVRLLGNFEGTFSGLLGEPVPVRFGLLERVDLGAMRIANVPVAIMPDDKMKFLVSGKNEFKIDFLLGVHLLKEFRVEFDFRRKRMTLMRIPAAARKPAADQNLFIERLRPVVRATINGHGWYLLILDTGSEVTFLNERKLPSLPLQVFAPKMHSATLQGLGGAEKHGEKLENVEIGVDRWAGTFQTIPMYDAGELEPTTGIIGENYLKNFNVVIDFGKMRVDLLPAGRSADRPD